MEYKQLDIILYKYNNIYVKWSNRIFKFPKTDNDYLNN